MAMRDLAIEQQPQPIGMAEYCSIAGGFELDEGLRHAGKSELVQLVEHRVREQSPFSLTA